MEQTLITITLISAIAFITSGLFTANSIRDEDVKFKNFMSIVIGIFCMTFVISFILLAVYELS